MSGFVASAKWAIAAASIGSVEAALAQGLRETTDLCRVRHADGKPRRREARRHHRLEAARRLHRDRRRRQWGKSRDQRIETSRIPARAEHLAPRANRDVALVLRNVDPFFNTSDISDVS